MPSLLLATTNPGKLRELRALFPLPMLTFLDPGQAGLDLEVEETGDSYLENARLKSEAYFRASGLWTAADDTGLEVEVLDGAPGVRSARVARNDAERRALLLRNLAPHPRPWVARFRCALVLTGPGPSMDYAQGDVGGEIIPEERGETGFGYDSIFLVEETGKTMAELDLATKNRISHRARAAQRLLPILKKRLGLE